MWQKEEKDRSIVSLALLLSLATIPMTTTVTVIRLARAQPSADTPSFVMPKTVPTGTTVSIDGSSSMGVINQTLKQSFEKQFSGTKVEVTAKGTDAALKALQNGNIDIAAISRELTPKEKAQGLEQIVLHREKIAIVVAQENPFKGGLSSKEFAQIFRGEIKNWSQLGGTADTIRFIDHPTRSDTRKAFHSYPVFQEGKFATGSTAIQLNEYSPTELVNQLGKDGISYMLANQASKLQGVRIVEINKILPKNSRYPFSQPSVYVYKKNFDSTVSSFLGFVGSPVGQKAIAEAIVPEVSALNSSVSRTDTTATDPSSTAQPLTTTSTSSPSAAPSPSVQATTKAAADNNQSFVSSMSKNRIGKRLAPLVWWLIPLSAVCGFSIWSLRRKSSSAGNIGKSTSSVLSKEVSTSEMPNSSVSSKEVSASKKPSLGIALTISEVKEDEPSEFVTNQKMNPTPAGASALTDGADLSVGVSSPLWSKFLEKGSGIEANIKTKEPDNNTEENSVTSIQLPSPVNSEAAKSRTSSSKQLYAPEVVFDLEAPVTVVNSVYRERREVPATSNTISSTKVLDLPIELETESTAETTKTEDMVTTFSNHSHQTAEVSDSVIQTGVAVEDIQKNTNLDVDLRSTNTNEATSEVDEANCASHIILIHRTPKWAYVCWAISESQKKALDLSANSQLVLRLYDVTHIDLSYQSPQLVQQYECEEKIRDRYVAIPRSDRNYMAEIGYVTNDNRWLLLARSSIVRVLERPERDFWFVADAELIIHGAAEPGSTVTLEGHAIKVKSDGTFHLRIPFTDKLIDYGITATAANGEQTKTIHMQFSQQTQSGEWENSLRKN